MKSNEEQNIHLGKNIKHLMRAFQITQTQLGEKLGMPDSHVCNMLQKADIDDNTLLKIAGALGNGIGVDTLKNYRHEDTISYITNNYTQNVENGGNGTLIPNSIQNIEDGGNGTLIPKQENNSTQNVENGGNGTLIPKQENNSTFQEGSTQNNYVAEQAFEFLKENAELKTEIMRLRMKYEPEAVEAELKKK